jgi:hypothetical protein
LNKIFESFIISSLYIFEKLATVLIAIIFGEHDLQLFAIIILVVFILPGELFIIIGMQTLEDKYEGGEIGISAQARDRMKVKHLEYLENLDLDKVSELDFVTLPQSKN